MRYKLLLLMVVCCFLSLAAFDYASAENLNIDFGAHYGTPSNAYGAASGQTGRWNTLGLGTSSDLLDIGGFTTAVSAQVTADDGDGWNGTPCGGDQGALIDDNFFSLSGNTWSVVLSGLTNGTYSVYLYAPTHPVVVTGNMLVNGIPVTSMTGDSCSLVNGTTYKTVTASVTNGTLTITGTASGDSGLAGLQIIPQSSVPTSVPALNEWGMIIFIALAGLGSFYYLRRRKIA